MFTYKIAAKTVGTDMKRYYVTVTLCVVTSVPVCVCLSAIV